MHTVRTRRALVAAVLVLSCAACFARLVMHPGDVLVGPQRGGANDLTDYFQPQTAYKIAAWRRFGRVPSWDPYLQLGRPITGNPQASLYYPPTRLPLLLGTVRVMSWIMVAHHLLAGWGMYLLCRRFEFAWPAALLGGVAFMAAPPVVAHTAEGHYTMTCAAAWIPWAMLCYERLRRRRPGGVPLLAIALALAFFCGHAQTVYYLVVALSAFVIIDLLRSLFAAGEPARLLLGWVFAGVLTAGLVAIDFLPIWITSKQTSRVQTGLSAEHAGGMGAQPANLWQLADPFSLGTPGDMEIAQNYWETLLYVGVVPLACAVFGLLLGWKKHPMGRYAALLIVATLFSLGGGTPLYPLLHEHLPGVATFRVPSRAMLLASAAVSVLAAGGVDRLLVHAAQIGKKGRIAWLIGLVALLGVAAAAYYAARYRAELNDVWPDSLAWQSLDKTFLPFYLMATAAALLAIFACRRRAPWAALLLVALVTLELGQHSYAITRTLVGSSLRTESELTAFFENSGDQYRVLVDHSLLGDEEAYRHGIAKVRGYEPFLLVRYVAVLQSALGEREFLPREAPGFETHPDLSYALGPLRLMGVRYAIVPGADEIDRPGWTLFKQGELAPPRVLRGGPQEPRLEFSIYELAEPLPRAFVLGQAESERTPRELIDQLAGIEPRETLIVPPGTAQSDEEQAFAPATIAAYSPSSVTVDAELSAPGYLVLTDMVAAGWKATVDGQPAPIVPVDVGFRGVKLPAGNHRVEMTFSPPLWQAGMIMSVLAFLATGFLLLRDYRRPPDEKPTAAAEPSETSSAVQTK